MRMKVGMALVALALVLAGCTMAAAHPAGSGATVQVVKVYFPGPGRGGPGNLFHLQPVARRAPARAAAYVAMCALLDGPTQAERERGFMGLPDASHFRVGWVSVRNREARVNFVSKGMQTWGGDMGPSIFKEAVEWTLLQLPHVRRAIVMVNGRRDFDSEA